MPPTNRPVCPQELVLIECVSAATLPHRSTTTIPSKWFGGKLPAMRNFAENAHFPSCIRCQMLAAVSFFTREDKVKSSPSKFFSVFSGRYYFMSSSVILLPSL